MKVVVDMNLSPRWVNLLTDAGIEAVHWSSVGAHTAPDLEIMTYAAAQNSVVLTTDLDFGTILALTRGEKPSVVQIRADDVSPDIIGAQITAALRQLAKELTAGALVTIERDRYRVRILPLRK